MTIPNKPTAKDPCPCGLAHSFGDCCQPIIEGRINASSAEALMRSRYSAHVVADVDYLINSWKLDDPSKLSRQDIAHWAQSSQWLGLHILDTTAGGNHETEGWVEFCAIYIAENTSKEQLHRERSRFVKDAGRWSYVEGNPIETSRNESCPCGSGKKYKRCHMN
ncbi:MAG: hypothetical protein CL693_12510 [Cellvibrionaceae bacterium]|nr:hypothetical protein [Cellvibrionaceae bacterium]